MVHRAYYTSYNLHKLGPIHSPACWRCSHPQGDFIHIFWSCPAISLICLQVLSVIQLITNISISPFSRVCWLGMVEDLSPRVTERTLIGLLMFYARKAIMLCWKKQTPTCLCLWKQLMIKTLPICPSGLP